MYPNNIYIKNNEIKNYSDDIGVHLDAYDRYTFSF